MVIYKWCTYGQEKDREMVINSVVGGVWWVAIRGASFRGCMVAIRGILAIFLSQYNGQWQHSSLLFIFWKNYPYEDCIPLKAI